MATTPSKKIVELEVKIFVVSMLLQELLDETKGNNRFKHQLKFHVGRVQTELDKLLTVTLEDDNLSMFITNAVGALEKAIDDSLVRE
jgi:hypothetical protein